VAARIRHGLPQYRDARDGEILRSPFPLQAAQDLLARERGFESWAALKAKEGEPSMTAPTRDTTTTPALIAAEPQLYVTDVLAACAYFKTTLGFQRVFVHCEPPFYAQVVPDGARLNIRQVDAPSSTSRWSTTRSTSPAQSP
jgi:hypothetical protein